MESDQSCFPITFPKRNDIFLSYLCINSARQFMHILWLIMHGRKPISGFFSSFTYALTSKIRYACELEPEKLLCAFLVFTQQISVKKHHWFFKLSKYYFILMSFPQVFHLLMIPLDLISRLEEFHLHKAKISSSKPNLSLFIVHLGLKLLHGSL